LASTDQLNGTRRPCPPCPTSGCGRGCERSPRAGPGGGWRRAAKGLRKEGWKVNNKRVQRLWREEGLKVPYRKRKKRPAGVGTSVGSMCPIAPDALWALDFQFDVTIDGRTLKLLNVIDEFTRECPAIVVDRSIDADRVVACLDRLMITRGAPAFVRFDIHPESCPAVRVLAS
jgi:putative transposase